MDNQFRTEIYKDLKKWIASQNVLARKKTNIVIFKGRIDLNKKKLLTMIVKDALENRVKIMNFHNIGPHKAYVCTIYVLCN